jgi:multimeric flavodoxin WrbA
MDRREFIKLAGTGMMALFFSGCHPFSAAGSQTSSKSGTPVSSSGGKKMKIVVITSSPHPKNESTSCYLADRFTAGAQEAGHEVFTFDAANSETHPCRGCDRCGMDGPCIFNDDIEKTLMPKMLEADMLVLVTPLYYYTVSAQLKTIIDRFYSRTERLHHKKSMLIATAYNSADWTFNALSTYYDTLVSYMEWQDMGTVLGYGCGSRSLVEKSKFGDEAYKIGAAL